MNGPKNYVKKGNREMENGEAMRGRQLAGVTNSAKTGRRSKMNKQSTGRAAIKDGTWEMKMLKWNR